MDESRLIEDAMHGDLGAFNHLILAYQDKVFNLAYRMLNDSDLAEDATQMAFIAAHRNLSSFRGGSFKAWLMRIVANFCMDELRKRYRRPIIPLEPANADNGEEFDSPAWLKDGRPTPEEQVELNELDAQIQRALQDLPDEYRAVVLLVDVYGFDYRETSLAVGKPIGTVKSRLARARLRLRESLTSSGIWADQPLYRQAGWEIR